MIPRWLLLPLVLAAGCAAPQKTNVLILTLDTTRADRLGCYGHAAAHTPHLDAFAAERAVRFDQAITAAPITLPSHTTIMSGTYPVFHGVHDNDGFIVDEELTTLAEILAGHGLTTGAVVAAYPLHSQFNLDQGFESYNDDFTEDWTKAELEARTPMSFGFIERTADQVNLAALRWLEDHGDGQFFLWMHYFDPHQAYQPPAPYDSQISDPYDGEIAFVDENFGALLEYLEQRDLLERTVVIVVGDHGESLYDHGEPSHASYVYDPTMRVPFLLAAPGISLAGRVVERQVRTIDIAPTVLDLLGIEAHADMQGVSLVPDLHGAGEQRSTPALLEAHYTQYHYGWAPLRALRTDGFKYVLAPRAELYDLTEDPAELYNLASTRPELLGEMAGEIDDLAARLTASDLGRSTAVDVDAEVRDRLAALGYLTGGGAAKRGSPFPTRDELAEMVNPVEHPLMLRFVNNAGEKLRHMRYEESVQLARQGLAIDPDNPRLQQILGRGLLGLRQLEQAVVALDRAAELNPSDAAPHALLGRTYFHLGRLEESLASLLVSIRLERDRTDVLELLGTVQGLLGETEEAIDAFERVVALDESNWSAHMRLGGALADAGRLEDARSAFQEALRLNPYSADVLNRIGVFYTRLGEVEFATRALRQAVQIEPDREMFRVHLADALLMAGGQEEARAHLEAAVELAPGSRWAETAQKWLDEHPKEAGD